MSAAAPLIPCASSPALSTRRARRARGLGTAARWGVRLAVFGLLVRGDGRPGALAQPLATTVQAPLNDRRDDVSAVSVIDLGLPGQAGAPSAYRVSVAEALAGQPGLVLQRGGGLGQFSGALLRGSSAHQILVLLDGVPILRGGQTAADLSLLPIDGIERIEVHRGAQRSPDEPLDLARAPVRAVATTGVPLPLRARSRMHRVVRRDPAALLIAHPIGHALGHRRGDEHGCAAAAIEDRALGIVLEPALDRDRAEGVGGAFAVMNDIEDDIRIKESKQEFDAEFIRLARAVYFENDERARVKREINVKLGSALVEEKSYQDYRAKPQA